MPDSTSAISSAPMRTLNDIPRSTESSLGKDQFLKILVTQLQNQDPMDPAKDTEFIAQLAQFSSLEQMSQMNTNFEMSNAFSMVGKVVYAQFTDSTTGQVVEILAPVDGVTKSDGKIYVQVGGYTIPSSDVQGMFDSALYDGIGSSVTSQLIQSANLVGKIVSAAIPATEDSPAETVVGNVDRLEISNGFLFAVINGKNVPVMYIKQILNEMPQELIPSDTTADELTLEENI